MDEEEYNEIYDETKEFYFSIKSVACPAINNGKIVFHGAGWRHLIFKNAERRPISEQLKRFKLLKNIAIIIKYGDVVEYSENLEGGIYAKFWKLEHIVGDIKIRVLIRQIDNGPKHFFSIFN